MDPYSVTTYVHLVPYGVEIPNRVFVGAIPFNMTELELKELFGQFGTVKDSKIITERPNGTSRGYGFVTFETAEEAIAVYSKGSLYYKGKKLNVAKAVRKQGGQYPKANQEYVNGQRPIYFHPSGYLMSQQDGAWVFEQPSPHSQPAKPYFIMPQGNQAQYIQSTGAGPGLTNCLPAPPISQPDVYSTSYYPALPSPTYSYITAPSPMHHSPPHQLQTICHVESTPAATEEGDSLEETTTSNHDNEEDEEEEEEEDKEIAALEEQTNQLSLNSSNEQPKPVHPHTNGFVRPSNQSKKPPKYLARRPAALNTPPHLPLSQPLYQPGLQYNFPPPHSGGYPASLAYSTMPHGPPHQYPISNIATFNFTPPLSPGLRPL